MSIFLDVPHCSDCMLNKVFNHYILGRTHVKWNMSKREKSRMVRNLGGNIIKALLYRKQVYVFWNNRQSCTLKYHHPTVTKEEKEIRYNKRMLLDPDHMICTFWDCGYLRPHVRKKSDFIGNELFIVLT